MCVCVSSESGIVSAAQSKLTKVPFPPPLYIEGGGGGEYGGTYQATAAPTSTSYTHAHAHTRSSTLHILTSHVEGNSSDRKPPPAL